MNGFRYTIVMHDRKKLQDAKSLFNVLHYYRINFYKTSNKLCMCVFSQLNFSLNICSKWYIYGTLHMLLYFEDL